MQSSNSRTCVLETNKSGNDLTRCNLLYFSYVPSYIEDESRLRTIIDQRESMTILKDSNPFILSSSCPIKAADSIKVNRMGILPNISKSGCGFRLDFITGCTINLKSLKSQAVGNAVLVFAEDTMNVLRECIAAFVELEDMTRFSVLGNVPFVGESARFVLFGVVRHLFFESLEIVELSFMNGVLADIVNVALRQHCSSKSLAHCYLFVCLFRSLHQVNLTNADTASAND